MDRVVNPGMIIFRADASVRQGSGHIMRCLSLAQGWRKAGGEAVFACAELTPSVEARIAAEGFAVHRLRGEPGSLKDAVQTAQLGMKSQDGDLTAPDSPSCLQSAVRGLRSDISRVWVVADGYRFDAAYQQAIKSAGLRLLLIDDFGHADHYSADLVLNQNLFARPELYQCREPHTRLLLGTQYVLLREQFRAFCGWESVIPATAKNLLVTLGGADPDNVTGRVVEAVRGLPVEARIVVGGSNPHFDSLVRVVEAPSSIIRDAGNMPELMAWADVAIAAGGTTSWELAFMGLPSLMIVLAENQRDVAARLDEAGVCVNLGPHAALTPDRIAGALRALLADEPRRRAMSRNGRSRVDGHGVSRVVTRLRAAALNLRPAEPGDCRLLWEWANDPEVRASAFSRGSIPWESHQAWFVGKLASNGTDIFIAANGDGIPLGQIRFDRDAHGGVEIDVSVRPAGRGAGAGSALIRAGVDAMVAKKAARVFNALVKDGNTPSVHAFEKAGFRRVGLVSIRGQPALHLTLVEEEV